MRLCCGLGVERQLHKLHRLVFSAQHTLGWVAAALMNEPVRVSRSTHDQQAPNPAVPTSTPGVGSPFDPNLHDAVMRELNNDVADGTVLEEFRKVRGEAGGWWRLWKVVKLLRNAAAAAEALSLAPAACKTCCCSRWCPPTAHTPAPRPTSPLQGFMFGEKLLRPAMVKVSYSDAPAPTAGGDSSADDAAASGASD